MTEQQDYGESFYDNKKVTQNTRLNVQVTVAQPVKKYTTVLEFSAGDLNCPPPFNISVALKHARFLISVGFTFLKHVQM